MARSLASYVARARRPIRTLVCLVCAEALTVTSLPRRSVTAACTHAMSVCAACVRAGIVAAVTDADWAHPGCPECSAPLSHFEIAALVEREVLTVHDEHVLIASIAREPEFRWCLTAGCKSGQLHDGGADSPIVTCRRCLGMMCFVHSVKWHEGQTCAVFQKERDRKEREEAGLKATMEHLKAKTKACPRKTCGIRIEKKGGCDHMICKKCHHHFSWSSARYS